MAGHVFIYGAIGTERGEISFDNVNTQLNDPEVKASEDLIVHIISPGGDVFIGEAIYNALKNTGKKIITHIEGTCASIATLIAGAGDEILMNKTARFMIHNPKISGMTAAADSRDLRHVANQLDQIKTLLIDVYDRKTSLGKEKLWALYDNETWLTADEAQQMGFIDESVDAIKAVATINFNTIMEKTKFEQLAQKFQNFLGLAKIKNEFQETLEDGTAIVVISDDEDWTGKQVITQDGAALADGTYKLASGKSITVAAGVITETSAPEAAAKTEDMEKDNRIKELEAQLAATTTAKETAEASLKAAQTQATTAEAKATRYINKVTELEKDFIALKEEASKTLGTITEPKKGPAVVNLDGDDTRRDPMGEEFMKSLKARNLV